MGGGSFYKNKNVHSNKEYYDIETFWVLTDVFENCDIGGGVFNMHYVWKILLLHFYMWELRKWNSRVLIRE